MINHSSKTNTTKTMAGYQVAPARGMLLDWRQPDLDYAQLQDAQQRQQLIAQKNAQAEATRAYLNQQEGYGADITPERMQAFGGEKQDQRIQGAVEERAQGQWDDFGQFATGVNTSPVPEDPYLAMLHGTQTRTGAGQLAELRGGNYARSGDLSNRKAMNVDDNTAAGLRNDAALSAAAKGRREARADERKYQQEDTQAMQAAMVKAYASGDPTEVLARYPQLANSQEFMYAMGEASKRVQDQVKQFKIDEERFAALGLGPGGMGPPKPVEQPSPKVDQKALAPEIPNQYFDPRVMTPRREGDSALQMQYDNIKNFLQYGPKTIRYGLEDGAGYTKQALEYLRNNVRF